MVLTSGYTDPSPYKERYYGLIGVDDTVTPPIPMQGLLGWTGSAWEKAVSDGAGSFKFALKPPASVVSGQKNVAAAGSSEALGASTSILSVTIKAKSANTGSIYVGGATVSSSTGYVLGAGESISLDIDNIADIYLDCSVNGEGVSYIGIVA